MKTLILVSLFFIGFTANADQAVRVKITPHADVGYSQMEIKGNGQVNLFDPTFKGHKLNSFMSDSRTEEVFCRLLGLHYVISDTGYTTENIDNVNEETKIDVVVFNGTHSFRLRKSNQFVSRVVCQQMPYTYSN